MRRRDFDSELARLQKRNAADSVALAEAQAANADLQRAAESALDAATHWEAKAVEQADTVAAVRAELADVATSQWLDHLRALTAERDYHANGHATVIIDRDEARGDAKHLRDELERIGAAWRARGEQLIEAEGRWGDAIHQLSASEVTVEALTDALVQVIRFAAKAVDKVPAKTTRRRYLAELADIRTAAGMTDDQDEEEAGVSTSTTWGDLASDVAAEEGPHFVVGWLAGLLDQIVDTGGGSDEVRRLLDGSSAGLAKHRAPS